MKLRLNRKTIESLKPDATLKTVFDDRIPGFHVRVTPRGVKTFAIFCTIRGRQRNYTIGRVEDWLLEDARTKALEVRRAAAKGIDAAAEKHRERHAETFGELAGQYMKEAKKHKKSWREDERIIGTYLNPKLKNIKANQVERSEVRRLLKNIAERAPIQANRVLAVIRRVYNWGIYDAEIEGVTVNPCDRMKAPAKAKRRDRVLSAPEIKQLWKKFEAEKSAVSNIFKLRLLTAQRGNEIVGMQWKEIELESRWWVVPQERSKNGMAHRVWLSDPVVKILEDARKENEARSKKHGQSEWVFPGKDPNKHLVETRARVTALKDNAETEDEIAHWTPHDLRRSAASMMTGTPLNVPRLVVGKILNHAEPGVTAVYDRHSYDREKREALDKWARRLMVIVSSLKAVEENEETS